MILPPVPAVTVKVWLSLANVASIVEAPLRVTVLDSGVVICDFGYISCPCDEMVTGICDCHNVSDSTLIIV